MHDSALHRRSCKGLLLVRGSGLGLLLLFFWLATSWSTAQAATLCVDKTNSPPCYATVQAAVNGASAGDTILIAAGTYQDGVINIPASKSLSLVGSGAGTTILDGGGTDRVFLIFSPTNLSELTVQNGYAQNLSGGGIHGSGPITLTNVDVLTNTADLTGGAISVDSDLILDHVRVRNNTASSWTGGAYANGIFVTNSLFQENRSTGQYGKGGGLWANSSLVITATWFISNSAVAGGGGAGGGSAVTVADSLFQGNSCSDINCKGGGLALASGTITGTQFISNTTLAAGGAVNATGVLNVINSKFSANVCTGNTSIGGALSLPSGTIYGSQIVSNTAGYYGGGLYASNTVVITSSQFVENSCSKSGCTGGGLYASGGTITGTEVLSNTSDANGAGVVFIDAGTIINSRFGANRCTYSACYGGGLYLQSGGSIAGSQFISNTSPYQGGGVYAQQWTTVTDSRFERNVTTGNLGQAGGLSLYQAGGSIARSEFISNTAQNKGGGLFSAGPVSVTDSLFQQNTTNTGSGGGAYSTGGTITGTLFISNTAGAGFGGGLANFGSPGSPSSQYITGTQFIANTAANGGALFNTFTTGQVVNGLMVRNTATNYGLAYYQEGPNSEMLLANTTIATPATTTGSAVVGNGGSLHITNTLVASYTTGIAQVSGIVSQDYNLFANVSTSSAGTVSGGAHSLTTDKSWFVAAANDNYHLLPGSPAWANGIDTGLLVDLDGKARPNPPSIGAYEGTKAPPSMDFSNGASASTEVPWQGTVTYTMVLTNTGPDPETNIIMTDVLPANVSFGHWITRPADTVSDSGGITWTGTLASGDAITWTLVVTNTGSGGTAITNTAYYSSTTLTGSAAATYSTVSTQCYPTTSGDWNTAFGFCPAGTKRLIPAGTTITLDGDLTLEGDFEIEPGATFNANGKTVTLTGGATQTLTGNPLPFSKLVINKTNKTDKVQIVGKLAVSKKLTITKGTLVSASEYGDLEIEGQGVVTLTNPISITGSFTNSGELYTQGHAVNFTGGLVQPMEQNLVLNVATPFDDLNVMTGTTLVEAVSGDNATIAGTLANFGIMRKTQAIAGTGAYHFGLAGSKDAGRFQVDVTAGGSLALLQVDRVDAGPANALGVTPLYWHFTPTGTGYNVTLTLPHNGLTSPGACRRVSGSTWNCKRSAYSATTVTRDGVTEFSDWAVFEMPPQPLAANDGAGTLQETPVTVSVLANDFDAAGGGLTVSAITLTPAHGTAVPTGDGQAVLYTPEAGFAGQDSFVYVAQDTNGSTDDALATVVVAPKSQVGEPPQIAPVDPQVAITTPFASPNADVEVQLPEGFFVETLEEKDILFLSYTPVVTPTEATTTPPGNLKFGNFEFNLSLFLNNEPQHGVQFAVPITVTIAYDPLILAGFQEATLAVYYWDEGAWSTAGIMIVNRDSANHTITIALSHLSQFGFFAQKTPTGLNPGDEPQLSPRLFLPEIGS